MVTKHDTNRSGERTTHAERKAQYESILRIVRQNTGYPDEPQPALMSRHVLVRTACQGGMETDNAKDRIQAAIENDDLVKYQGRIGVRDTEGLRKWLGELNDAEVKQPTLMRSVWEALEEVRDGE